MHFEKLKKLSIEQLLKIVDFRGMFQIRAVMYLEFLHHTIHHRGRLSMYLLPMGAEAPLIDGESYDAAEAHGGRKYRAFIRYQACND